jgi:serine-type D-Ala-D-Ala endopeptidase (penicillin-binding protein 7)
MTQSVNMVENWRGLHGLDMVVAMLLPRPTSLYPCLALLLLVTAWSDPAWARRRQPKVRSKAVLMVSFDGRKVFHQRNASKVRSIASLSKLMAVLVVMDRKLKLDGITTISSVDVKVGSGGCRTRLLKGMKVHNKDLLYAALLASDNRSVSALGRAAGLTTRQLVAAMNARARKMKLRHTRFIDPVGINHGNVSTAYEVAKILRQAVLHPILQKVMRTRNYYFRPVWPKRRSINYHNTNALVHRLRFPVYGGKTGFNNKAGYCFASAMRLPGAGPVLAVFLGSSSKTRRFADFYAVLNRLKRRGTVRADRRVAGVRRRKRIRRRVRKPKRRPTRRTPQLYAVDED